MNVIFQDLGAAAEPVILTLLHSLTPTRRAEIAQAIEGAAAIELRMRTGAPSLVALWLIESDGQQAEIARTHA